MRRQSAGPAQGRRDPSEEEAPRRPAGQQRVGGKLREPHGNTHRRAWTSQMLRAPKDGPHKEWYPRKRENRDGKGFPRTAAERGGRPV
eukprot:6274570-Heterocapsa_arctica.AAC.1